MAAGVLTISFADGELDALKARLEEDMEAAGGAANVDKFVDHLDDPRVLKRFGRLPFRYTRVMLRILDRVSPRQVLPRSSSTGRAPRRARFRRGRSRARSPGRPGRSEDPDPHHQLVVALLAGGAR